VLEVARPPAFCLFPIFVQVLPLLVEERRHGSFWDSAPSRSPEGRTRSATLAGFCRRKESVALRGEDLANSPPQTQDREREEREERAEARSGEWAPKIQQ
jgi:hypothetical protein